RNIRLVHWIGMALIIFTFVSAAADSWYRARLTASLEQQVISVEGTKMRFAPPPAGSEPLLSMQLNQYEFHLPLGGVLTGLLILSLGEVFRQGLVLKEDNELTV
ncbi:MAG TPA: hypothetical protein VEC99_11200, partial [Clostridia bacterium]|nr:hypothetical protein [Clostridia bacterium]